MTAEEFNYQNYRGKLESIESEISRISDDMGITKEYAIQLAKIHLMREVENTLAAIFCDTGSIAEKI